MPIVKVFSQAGKLQFQIFADGGVSIAKSIPYRKICNLEDALRSLYRISMTSSDVVFSNKDGLHQISAKSMRQRLTLSEVTSSEHFVRILKEISNARIIDSRSPERRRTDLGGSLKSLM
jgi:hypothetical protein